MQIHVDDAARRVTFLYKLEDGVAEGSFGMHCASMCGISSKIVERAEAAAKEWEHTSRERERIEDVRGIGEGEGGGKYVELGWQSDVAWLLREGLGEGMGIGDRGVDVLRRAVEGM